MKKILDFFRAPAILKVTLGIIALVVCLGCTVFVLLSVALGGNTVSQGATGGNMAVLDRYDMAITNQLSASMDGILSIDKVYWLRDEDVVAPEPNQKLFGQTYNPRDIADVIEAAQEQKPFSPRVRSTPHRLGHKLQFT